MEIKTGIERWREANGDETFALDWNLNGDSQVWEIGGYEGRWAQQIWDKFHCYITIFEPQLWAVEKLQKRFLYVNKIDVRPYGLWIEDNDFLKMNHFETDGASIMPSNEDYAGESKTSYAEFRDYYFEIHEFNREIDLCLMNIEGSEYILIPRLIATRLISRFNYFWCQFHPIDGNDKRHETIMRAMEKTHEKIWDFFPTAVAWKRKEK